MTLHERYELLVRQARDLITTEADFVANAGNFAALVYHELPEINWAGFYLARPSGELALGPFAGRPACTRLASGRGACGAAARSGSTLVIDDVTAFHDHIVCDPASRSEIVVPLFKAGTFWGVFDCDSPQPARFTEADRTGIERLVKTFTESVDPPLYAS